MPKSLPKSAPAAADSDVVPSRRRGRRKSASDVADGTGPQADQLGEVVAGLVALQASHDQLLAEVRGLRREVKALRPPAASSAVSRRGKPPAAAG